MAIIDLEQTWVRSAAGGDVGAFEQLVGLHQRKVYSQALRMVRSPEDAEDLAQEAFVRAWEKLPQFKGDSSFSTWLFRLTANICVDFLRREGKRKNVSLTLGDEDEERVADVPDPAAGPQEELERSERARLLGEALNELSAEYRQIFTMREGRGMSYDEIGAALGIPAGTVKSRLFRAREQLRELLAPHGNLFERNTSKEMRNQQ